jgi:hypothetical protein
MTYSEALLEVVTEFRGHRNFYIPSEMELVGATTLEDLKLGSLDLVEVQLILEDRWPSVEGKLDSISGKTSLGELAMIVQSA